MDVQFLRCHSNTKKCTSVNNDGSRSEKTWECRDGDIYIAPAEIPREGTVILAKVERGKNRKWSVSKKVIEISADMVRKCFTKIDEYVEEGG